MRNTITVFTGADELECTQYNGGVDVKDASNDEYLGFIENISIPDFEDEEEIVKFNKEVEDWFFSL